MAEIKMADVDHGPREPLVKFFFELSLVNIGLKGNHAYKLKISRRKPLESVPPLFEEREGATSCWGKAFF